MPRLRFARRFGAPHAVAALLVGLLSRPAAAAPNDGFALSNDAALRGGTAVALGRDAASVWYNPASAAATYRLRFDASASAYGLKSTRAPGAMEARVGDRVQRATGIENQILVVPTAASFAFGWPGRGFAIALSFHTPQYAESETRVRLQGRNLPGMYRYEQEAHIFGVVRRYHAGATLAWEPVEHFRFGATLSGFYAKDIAFTRFVAHADDAPSGAFSTIIGDLDAASRLAGVELSTGVQGELTPWLHAGASFRAPGRVLWQNFEGGQTVGVTIRDAFGTTVSETSTDPSTTGNAPRWLTPWSVAAGLGLVFDRAQLEVDAEASPPLRRAGPTWERRAVWNVRAGASYQLSNRWIIGSGLFTDRSSQASSELYPTALIHRYGGSLAVRLRSPVRLHKSEHVRRLVFETTVAVRYAFGLGTVGKISTVYPDDGPEYTTLDISERTEATQHLLTLHVGTGLKF